MRLSFGSISEKFTASQKGVVAFPVNNSFEDRCFDEENSALGSFLKSLKFSEDEMSALKRSRDRLLLQFSSTVGLDDDVLTNIGCTFHHRVRDFNMVIAASSVRTETGVVVNISDIYLTVEGILKEMARRENEYVHLVVPLIGAGKAGLHRSVAFDALVSAVLEQVFFSQYKSLRSVCIVIFAKADLEPEIAPSKVKLLLDALSKRWPLEVREQNSKY